MLDTVVITTSLSRDAFKLVRQKLNEKRSVDVETGVIDYTMYADKIVTGLSISNVVIRTQAWQIPPGSRIPRMTALYEPLMIVEGSVHKSMLGHNVSGGPRDIQPALRWYLDQVGQWFGWDVPDLDKWAITRLDIAETYDLGSEENVLAWIQARKLATYPRRKVVFRDTGFEAVGSTTVLRAYAKGAEFTASGAYSAMKRVQPYHAGRVLEDARKALRCELQVNREKLVKLFPTDANGAIIKRGVLNDLYDKEWGKFMQEANYEHPVLRASEDVWHALDTRYPEQALNLYQVWMILATRGEDWYRTRISKATWFRQKAIFKECSIGWLATDLITAEMPIADFIPKFSAHQRLRDTHTTVQALEQAFA